MQAETYKIKDQEIPLLRLAQKVASKVTSDDEAKEIIELVRAVNPPRAEQLKELREKYRLN